MTPGFLPSPGQPLGPCDHECHHMDCAGIRTVAETPCALCSIPIGYETEYITLDGETYHAACLETEMERAR